MLVDDQVSFFLSFFLFFPFLKEKRCWNAEENYSNRQTVYEAPIICRLKCTTLITSVVLHFDLAWWHLQFYEDRFCAIWSHPKKSKTQALLAVEHRSYNRVFKFTSTNEESAKNEKVNKKISAKCENFKNPSWGYLWAYQAGNSVIFLVVFLASE